MDQDDLQLTSPAFADGDEIPAEYTCKGRNISPPLEISGVPAGTETLAIVMHDPDAPNGDFLHWTIWNLPPDIREIPAGTVPDSAVEGVTGFGKSGYGGPCPPSGTHRYIFELYALDEQLNLSPDTNREEFLDATDANVIAKAALTGTFSAAA